MRFGVVVTLLFLTAVLAGVAHAEDGVVVEDVATTTPSDPTSSDTGVSSDPATDTTGTQPSTDPASPPTDPSTSPSETPTGTPTATDPPADNTGTEQPSPPPGDTAQQPEPLVPGDAAGGSGSETPVATDPPPPSEAPLVTDPVPPATDDPPVVVIDDGTTEQPPATPSFGAGDMNDTGLLLDVQAAAPSGLDLLKIGGAATTKGRDARLSDNDARSTKEQSARRSLPSGGFPASSPSSAASGASGAGSGGGGGGVALAVEFLLAALLVLHYTRRASFTLPDSLAFALREERPG